MEAFWDLTILLSLAAGLGLLANRLKQPLILGYICAGVIIQLTGILDMHSLEGFELFSKIGIVFLLFILGLELDLKEMGSLGIASVVTGIGQILFTVGFGFLLSMLFGYSFEAGLIISIALTFSSTIVIVKLLSRKGELDTEYGRLATGFLLVQDLVAIVILVILSASLNSSSGVTISGQLLNLALTLPFMVLTLGILSKFLIPALIKFTQHDREVLFVSVIALALVYSSIVATDQIGLSIEIGAIAAGIALSDKKEALQIESWTKPLRDFFIPVFFVLLGFQIQVGEVSDVILPALVFSVFVLVGNPLIVLILMRLLKFDTITGFKAGLTVAQISEFSLLVADMALKNGTITDSDLTMLTIVGGITMTGSSYMILYSDQLYEKIRPTLKFFGIYKQEEYDVESYKRKQIADRVVIFGFNRMARSLEGLIKKGERRFLIIDNDPARLDYADRLGATTAFGDLKDENLIHELKLKEAHLIISTVPDMHANLGLLYYLKENNIGVPTVVNAFYDQDAMLLYEEGADFVIHPYLLVSGLLERIVMNKDTKMGLKRAAAKDINFLSKYK